jgi:hypothetical protein
MISYWGVEHGDFISKEVSPPHHRQAKMKYQGKTVSVDRGMKRTLKLAHKKGIPTDFSCKNEAQATGCQAPLRLKLLLLINTVLVTPEWPSRGPCLAGTNCAVISNGSIADGYGFLLCLRP